MSDQLDIDALLKHLGLFYSDWAIAHDMDCVRPLVTGWCLDVVNEYARARRMALGYRKNDPKVNSHSRISPEAWDRINAKRKVGFIDRSDVHSIPCGSCGQTFSAKRADARFCSPRCRQRATRSVTDNLALLASVGLSANARKSGFPDPAIAGGNLPVSVTWSAA